MSSVRPDRWPAADEQPWHIGIVRSERRDASRAASFWRPYWYITRQAAFAIEITENKPYANPL